MTGQVGSRTPLSSLSPGEAGNVVEVGAGPSLGRLLELGLLPGTRVMVARRAPLGDPLEVRLRGFALCLRRNEAETILVETVLVETAPVGAGC